MKLRNAHFAVIDRSKVLDYLLNEAHPDNGGKARFFSSAESFAARLESPIGTPI